MKPMHKLVKLMEAQYQQSRQSLQSILTHEARIRSELAELQQHQKLAQRWNITDEKEMRAMGADVIWEKWLGKTTTKLNLELAIVLAKKEIHLVNVRKNFGKLQAATTKSEYLKSASKRKAQLRDLEKIITNSILKG